MNLFALLFAALGGGVIAKVHTWAQGASKVRGAQLKGLVPASQAQAAADTINTVTQPLADVAVGSLTDQITAAVQKGLAPHSAEVANSTRAVTALVAKAAISIPPPVPAALDPIAATPALTLVQDPGPDAQDDDTPHVDPSPALPIHF